MRLWVLLCHCVADYYSARPQPDKSAVAKPKRKNKKHEQQRERAKQFKKAHPEMNDGPNLLSKRKKIKLLAELNMTKKGK